MFLQYLFVKILIKILTNLVLSDFMLAFALKFFFFTALQIQRRWRGFFVRKYIQDFYARKKYLEGLLINNELMRYIY